MDCRISLNVKLRVCDRDRIEREQRKRRAQGIYSRSVDDECESEDAAKSRAQSSQPVIVTRSSVLVTRELCEVLVLIGRAREVHPPIPRTLITLVSYMRETRKKE